MAEQIEIRVHVPNDLGLTEQQIADLKQKVRIEIVASTLPVHGLTPQAPQQIVVAVDNHNLL